MRRLKAWFQRPKRVLWSLLALNIALLLLVVFCGGSGITVSPETTAITEPLDDAGFVDYLQHHNRVCGAGVTAENNAAVLFARLDPAKHGGAPIIAEFYRQMNLAPPHGVRPLLDYDQFLQTLPARPPDLEKQIDYLETAKTRPWTAAEFPELARYIQEYTPEINLAVEASRLPRVYWPGSTVFDWKFIAFMPPWFGLIHSSIGPALASRAMLRLGEGNLNAAWSDLLALHRLSRLTSACPTSNELLVARGTSWKAWQPSCQLAQSPLMTANLAVQMLQDLRELRPHPKGINAQEAERWMCLSLVQAAFREGYEPRHEPRIGLAVPGLPHQLSRRAYDWNAVMRRINFWFDRWEAAAALKPRAARRTAIHALARDFQHVRDTVKDKSATEWFSAGSQNLADSVMPYGFPWSSWDSDDRSDAQTVVLQTQLAARLWQLRRGVNPKTPGDLVPEFLPDLPVDPFDEKPLKFAVVKGELQIYSISFNRIDDGGRPAPWHNSDIVATLPAIP